MHFGILGPLDVRHDDALIPIQGARLARLLAILLVRSNEVVSTDRLTEDLWDGEPPFNATATLHTYISKMRSAFGAGERDRLVTRRPGYLVRIEPEELDSTQFEQLAGDARRAAVEGQPSLAIDLFDRALAFWRGEALSEFRDAPFARVESVRLGEARSQAVEERVAAQLALGLGAELVSDLERNVSDEPLRERRWGQLMLALYRAGRQADALRRFQDLRHVLGEELGIDPSPELVQLEHDILDQEPRLLEARTATQPSAPMPPPAVRARASLPTRRMASPLVGRGAELEFLRAAFAEVATGVRPLIVVLGEPGIGKTALVSAFADELRAAGAPVLSGRCDAEILTPYQPVVEALRDWAIASSPERLREVLGTHTPEIARHVPAISAQFVEPSESEQLDAETQRYRWFEAAAAMLGAILDGATGLLVIDDVHWADAPTLRLLRHLVLHAETASLLVVATARPGGLDAPGDVGAILADLRQVVAVERLELAGIDEAAVGAMVEFGADRELGPAGQALAHRIHGASGGNPFYVGELTRHLRDSGVLASLDETLGVRLDASGIPASIREVVGQRIARLEPDQRAMLQLGAVLGPEFDPEVLREVADVEYDAVVDALDAAEHAHLVAPMAHQGRYVFTHAIVREAMYAGVSTARRQALHNRIASVFESLNRQRPDEYLAALAYHASEAVPIVDPAVAIDYARRAGDVAASRAAHEVAALHYERALQVIEACEIDDPILRCNLLLAVGEAHNRAGDVTAGKHAFRLAAGIARNESRADLLARAAMGYGGPVAATPIIDDPLTVDLLEEAIDALGPSPSSARARAEGRLAQWLYAADDPARRHALCDEAIAVARGLDDPTTLALVLNSRYWALYGPDDVDERLAVADEIASIGEQLDAPELVLQGTQCRLHALIERGDWDAAQLAASRRTDLARALSQPQYLWTVTTFEAMQAATEGRLDDAEQLATNAFAMRRRTEDIGATAVFFAQMQQIRWLQGRLGEVVPVLEQLVERDPDRPTWHSALAWACAETGDVDGATREVSALARRGLSAIPRNFEWLATVGGAAIAIARIGDTERAAELYSLLEPCATHNCAAGQSAFYGAVAHHLGALAATIGRDDAARLHFHAALERHREFRSPPLVALTEDALAALG